MPALPTLLVPALFAVLALVFGGLALRAGRAGTDNPARRTWRRIAILFAVVTATLLALAWIR